MKAIVPARGGSKGIRRKNLTVVDGKPLLLHICQTLTEAGHEVIVSTEDPEIRSVALLHGYQVHDRNPSLSADDVPVSTVAEVVGIDEGLEGPVIVAQPTCPNITVETINRLTGQLAVHSSATVVVPNSHIIRQRLTRVSPPVNRQEMSGLWREVGVRVFASPDISGETPQGIVEVGEREGADIDNIWELAAAQPARNIQFHTTGNQKIGHGHIHRSLALAAELQHHDILFHVTDTDDEARQLIEDAGWEFTEIGYPFADLVILDQLDNSVETVTRFKAGGALVVTIEDLGPGAAYADLVINSLYPLHLGTEKTGGRWADLRSEFLSLPPYPIRHSENSGDWRLLLMFGGTDPSGLGEKFGKWFPWATLVERGADISVAWEMTQHDVLITSAGRTVYEAAAVGIPSIVVAANPREARHAHLGWEHGNVFLGHGRLVSESMVRNTVNELLNHDDLRREMSDRGREQVDGLGLQRIAFQVDGLLKGLL